MSCQNKKAQLSLTNPRDAKVCQVASHFCEILRKFELIAVQGHPRSSILVSMDSSYATSYQSLIVTGKDIRGAGSLGRKGEGWRSEKEWQVNGRQGEVKNQGEAYSKVLGRQTPCCKFIFKHLKTRKNARKCITVRPIKNSRRGTAPPHTPSVPDALVSTVHCPAHFLVPSGAYELTSVIATFYL